MYQGQRFTGAEVAAVNIQRTDRAVMPAAVQLVIVQVLIRGKPSAILGLDEGIFVRSTSPLRSKRDIYVMSERACKLFRPMP